MIKSHKVVTISLTALLFITGCPQKNSAGQKIQTPQPQKITALQNKPPQTKTTVQQPPKPETKKVEPQKPEPNEPVKQRPQPAKTEPEKNTPKKTEPQHPAPKKVEPEKADSVKPAPEKLKTTQPKAPNSIPLNPASFHDKSAEIFKKYVDENGLVDYYTLKRNRTLLNKISNDFAKLDPNKYNSWPKKDKIAFWLNACNIQMLKIIIDNYPIQSTRIHRVIWPPSSIRHIRPWGVIRTKKWDRFKFIVMDEQFTLSEIQQRFFISEFAEPEIFFALSGASHSSPLLRNEPYYGNKLEKQLDNQVKKFLAKASAFKIDRQKQKIYLSAIFQDHWYGRHFTDKYATEKKFKDHKPTERAVLNFISKYISKADASFLNVGNYTIKYTTYDWRLNDTKNPKRN